MVQKMSHDFELHHLVSELVLLLRVSGTADVDAQVDLLLKNRTPYITNQVCQLLCSPLPQAHFNHSIICILTSNR